MHVVKTHMRTSWHDATATRRHVCQPNMCADTASVHAAYQITTVLPRVNHAKWVPVLFSCPLVTASMQLCNTLVSLIHSFMRMQGSCKGSAKTYK
jgi:hypothetical protein